MKKIWKDEQIINWSIKTFICSLKKQTMKVNEEIEELYFELADVWIAKLGLVARGGNCETFPKFCESFNVNPKKLRTFINKKMRINSERVWEVKKGIIRHK